MRFSQHLSFSVAFILVLSLVFIGIYQGHPVQAQSQSQPRYKTVDKKVTQYIWNLLQKNTGQVICEVIIDREGEPSQQDALNSCPDKIRASLPGIQNQSDFYKNSLWKFIIIREFTTTEKIQIPDIVINISIPQGPLQEPYVTLIAYELDPQYKIISIQGTVLDSDFICYGSRCDVPVNQSATIKYYANSSLGDKSQEFQANLQVANRSEGYYITLLGTIPSTVFADVCANIWASNRYSYPSWANFPQFPYLLDTTKPLYYLASRLIVSGQVDAKDCAGQGLFSDGSPNACGMDRVSKAMIDWQNQFDPLIWSAARDIGIPPKMIKVLIEKESQFWPGNSRTYMDEFGLAQMNQTGADVALRYDNQLFKQTCTGLLADCGPSYATLPTWQQAMVRGKLMSLINSDCPTCNNGLNMANANASIKIITQVIKSNCSQVGFIMKDNSAQASYENLWKFTLVSYHSGYRCLDDAIIKAKEAGQDINWENVSQVINCPGAKSYVDDVWTSLTDFDKYLKVAGDVSGPLNMATFAPKSTPMPIPTPRLSHNSLQVFVYLVFERKPFPENSVWVDDVPVQVILPNGDLLTQNVKNGQTTFDMSAYPVGSLITVNLPTLYRSQSVTLTDEGEILISFRFVQPLLPNTLP